MTICAVRDCVEHYGCQLRNKGLMLSAKAIPNRVFMRPTKMAEPSWEKGVLMEPRAGGAYHVPVLNSDLSGPVPLKTYEENRHRIDDARRRQLTEGVTA